MELAEQANLNHTAKLMRFTTSLLSVAVVLASSLSAQTITVDKTSCRDGGRLAGAFSRSMLGLRLDLGFQGLPGAYGILVASPKGDTSPFNMGFRRCILLSTPVVLGLFQTDRRGGAKMSLRVPSTRGRVEGFLQAVTLVRTRGGAKGASSNTLKAVIR